MRRALFIVSVIILLNLFIFPQRALACSCMMNPSPQIALEGADAVFSGRVMKIDKPLIDIGENKVTISVKEVWKGRISKEAVVTTAGQGSMCGYGFQEGKEYFIYAHGDEDLSVSSCSRTTDLSSANQDLLELGEGSDPLKEDSASSFSQQVGSNLASNPLLIGVGLLMAAFIGFFFGKKF